MASNPMGAMPGMDDSDDQGGSYEQCEQEIEALEARVSVIEKKLGIQSPADDEGPAAAAPASPLAGLKGKPKPSGNNPFFGSY